MAAVFTILRSRSVSLIGRIRPLLELESALNDPTALFLSVGLLALLLKPAQATFARLGLAFIEQMGLGLVLGAGAGRATRWIINRVHLEYEGLYPVLSVALVLLTFGLTQAIGGTMPLSEAEAGALASALKAIDPSE